MTMVNLDNVFDDDLDLGPELDSVPEPDKGEELDDLIFDVVKDEPNTPSIIDELLAAKGIKDAKIQILNDKNETEEVDFYSLSKEEQLEILNSHDVPELAEYETQFLETLRANNISIDEFLERYKDTIINELSNTTEPTYEIDNYDDQELFLLDLKNKFDLTDEELTVELEKELQNEDLFKKKVSKIREEYKKLEEDYKAEKEAEFNKQREQEYETFANSMVEIAVNTPELYGIELEDEEKNEVLSYLLDIDDSGTSNFYKSLNDPKKLYEMAWFARYGKDVIDTIVNAYEEQISKLKDNPVVVKKGNTKQKTTTSIYDIDFLQD